MIFFKSIQFNKTQVSKQTTQMGILSNSFEQQIHRFKPFFTQEKKPKKKSSEQRKTMINILEYWLTNDQDINTSLPAPQPLDFLWIVYTRIDSRARSCSEADISASLAICLNRISRPKLPQSVVPAKIMERIHLDGALHSILARVFFLQELTEPDGTFLTRIEQKKTKLGELGRTLAEKLRLSLQMKPIAEGFVFFQLFFSSKRGSSPVVGTGLQRPANVILPVYQFDEATFLSICPGARIRLAGGRPTWLVQTKDWDI